jgi:signal transduction histidine kinase/CheY-like chemotaxis protein
MLARDGRTLWVRDEARLVRAEERTVARVQGLLQDVTELRRAQELTARQREALHQTEKVAAMGQLLAGVAHELNNPLSVVLGQAALLRRTLAGRAEEVRVDRMEQAAARCARIVRSFLALARQQPPSRAAVAVDRLIGEVVELLIYPLRVDDIDLRVEVAPDLPELWADGHQVQQLLINLLSNAHHVLKSSAAPRRLTLAGHYDAATREVVLDVADNGPGIAPEVLSRLFEPFFTTKPVGEGTGLGLSLCRGIAEGHGGTIRVESEPGRGARFEVRLPARAATAASLPASAGVQEPRRNSADILVVDDEASVAELVADIAAAEGHRVKTAGDGATALRLLEAARFDLVLADIRMPGLSGPELYHHAVARWPELRGRFVFLTGDTLAPATWEFLSEAGRPHLAKPFSADDVSRILNEGLDANA